MRRAGNIRCRSSFRMVGTVPGIWAPDERHRERVLPGALFAPYFLMAGFLLTKAQTEEALMPVKNLILATMAFLFFTNAPLALAARQDAEVFSAEMPGMDF